MQFSDLLSTFRTELLASLEPMPDWLTALAAREEDGNAAQEAVASYGECMQRSSETAAMLGLDGLAAFFAQRGENAILLAMSGNLERIMHEADWPEFVQAYLANPCPDNSAPLAQWLLEICADEEQSEAVMCLLAQEIQIPPDLIAQRERRIYGAHELALQAPADVDHKVYEAFVNDAPEQAARVSQLLARYFSSSEEPALNEARRIVHTFKGTANIIGIVGIGRFAHALEDLLDRLAEKPADTIVPAPLRQLCSEAADGMEFLVDAHLLRQDAAPETLDLMQRIGDWEYALSTSGWEEAQSTFAALERAAPVAEIDSSVQVTSGPSADAAPSVATTAVDEENRPTVRIAVDTVDALLRASSELAVQVAQLKEQLTQINLRSSQLTAEHSDAQRSVQALQLAVDTHSMRQAAVAGGSVDPLEMDRYNELSSLARMTAESVDDARAVGQGFTGWIAQTDAVLATQAQLQKRIQSMILDTRMVTAGALSARLARAVRQTARTSEKDVAFAFYGENIALDADVLDALAAPLIHILRNAVDHGIEPTALRADTGKPVQGQVQVRFARVGARVELTVSDDGGGYDFAAIRDKAIGRGLIGAADVLDHDSLAQLTLLPGFSTAERVTETSGRGVGMDVVAESVRKLNGQLQINSVPGEGTRMVIRVPASLAMMHLLIVQTAAGRFAIPSSSIDQALAPGLARLDTHNNEHSLHLAGRTFAVRLLSEQMGVAADSQPDQCAWILLDVDRKPFAIGVEALATTREAIVRKPGRMAGHAGLLGATLDINGTVLPVLDLAGMVRHESQNSRNQLQVLARKAQRTWVMVVDDSVSVRRSLTQLLEDAGYAVCQARDGLDALSQLNNQPVRLVLTDLEMPEMNGIDFTRNLRSRADTDGVPVVMITSRSTDKHRDMAKAAGVDHYLVKPYTDQVLLDLVRRLTNQQRTALEALAAE
jgi:chemotaxis protein histidine kinase CheA/ActR/RegA family two-component response regulator